jgi:hypothetical protein
MRLYARAGKLSSAPAKINRLTSRRVQVAGPEDLQLIRMEYPMGKTSSVRRAARHVLGQRSRHVGQDVFHSRKQRTRQIDRDPDPAPLGASLLQQFSLCRSYMTKKLLMIIMLPPPFRL